MYLLLNRQVVVVVAGRKIGTDAYLAPRPQQRRSDARDASSSRPRILT